MNYTVWRHGVLLGQTDLAMSSPGPNWQAGQLEPTIEFERAWSELAPTIEELMAAMVAVGSAIADLPPPATDEDPAERGRRVHEWLAGHPGGARLRAASEAMSLLGLELRDATGGLVATESIMIQEIRPPAWVTPEAIARHVDEARSAGLDGRLPAYFVVVQNATGAREVSSASRPHA